LSLQVKQKFYDAFKGDGYPEAFIYRQRVIILFQKIDGVDVALYCMYVQEYGADCLPPNRNVVYLSYIDRYAIAVRVGVVRTVWLVGQLKRCISCGLLTQFIVGGPFQMVYISGGTFSGLQLPLSLSLASWLICWQHPHLHAALIVRFSQLQLIRKKN
jgi:hypothetical protein